MNTMDSLNLVDEDPAAEADEWDEVAGEDHTDYVDYYEEGESENIESERTTRSQWITSHDYNDSFQDESPEVQERS